MVYKEDAGGSGWLVIKTRLYESLLEYGGMCGNAVYKVERKSMYEMRHRAIRL